MKLQHGTTIEGIIGILESGFMSPPKRRGIKSWSEDFLFFRFVDDDENERGCSVYTDVDIIKKYKSFFIHPSDNLYGMGDTKNINTIASEIKIIELMELFESYDRNKDGIINLKQVNQILKTLKMLVPFRSKHKTFDFPTVIYIITKYIACDNNWEYISPKLANRLQIEGKIVKHDCTVDSLKEAMSMLVKNVDYNDGGNEIGFDLPIYVKDFKYITISKKEFQQLKEKQKEKLIKLLNIYKRRGLKVRILS